MQGTENKTVVQENYCARFEALLQLEAVHFFQTGIWNVFNRCWRAPGLLTKIKTVAEQHPALENEKAALLRQNFFRPDLSS